MYDRTKDIMEREPVPVADSQELLQPMSVFQAERRNRTYDPLPKIRKPTEAELKLKQLGYIE